MTHDTTETPNLKKARRVLAARSFKLQRQIAKAQLEQRDTLAALAAVDEALGQASHSDGDAEQADLRRTDAAIKAAAMQGGFHDSIRGLSASIGQSLSTH